MKFGEITIPDELLEAQRKNELVIFAGAGVSKAHPSNMPLFRELADQVETKFGIMRYRKGDSTDRASDETIDSFMGRVANQHNHDLRCHVQSEYSANRRHNRIHEDIVRLFCANQALRVVTTNYDKLLTDAISKSGFPRVTTFTSPALPADERQHFEGVAYVHGSVLTDNQNLVLTKRDFSKAYMNDGWVAGFMQYICNKYCVLFIGYSLNDVIVDYLLSGLDNPRVYAFCEKGDRQKWEDVRVEPLYYELKQIDTHYELREALEEWADWTQSKCAEKIAPLRNYEEEEKTIAKVVQAKVTDETESEAIILGAVSSLPTTRFFTKYAKSPDWLYWLDEQNVIVSLFDPYEKLTDAQREIAKWVAEVFAVDHYQHLLELIHKHGDQVNQDLWSYLIWQVTNNEPPPSPDVRAIWVTVLLKNVPNNVHLGSQIEYLLKKCNWEDDRYSILKILSYLLEPIAVSEHSLSSLFGGTDTEYKHEYRLTLRGEHYWLNEVWQSLRGRVGDFWREFLPTVEKYLTDAYHMNATFDKSGGDQDVQSWMRSAIEKHEQDESNRKSFDVLIDAGRDILEYLLKTKGLRTVGRQLIESWFATRIPLLRRIAIHGVSVAQYWKDTSKIKWLLDKGLVHRTAYQHEVFQVIKAAIGGCDESTVEKLVKHAVPTEPLEVDGEEARSIREYEKFNLLNWMNIHAQDSQLIKEALDEVLLENPNFLPREHPDLGHWTSGVHQVTPNSPNTGDELREMPMAALVDLLITFKKRDPMDFHDQRRGLLDTMLSVVVSDFEWSMRLANELAKGENYKSDVWYNLIKGWEKSTLSDEEWGAVIEFLSDHATIHTNTDATCDLLENIAKKEEVIAGPVLTAMEQLADKVWIEISKAPGVESTSGDWLTEAINNGAGKLGEFWIQALHKRSVLAGESWKGTPGDYKSRFEEYIGSNSHAGQLIRVVLVSRFHYLYSHAQDWSRGQLLPLLDYSKGELRAEQAWHGYLMWGRMPMDLFDDFKRLYSLAAKRLKDTDHNMREHLFKHITDIWLEDRNDPPDFNWFYNIISDTETTDDDREHVAFKLWHRIGQTEEDDKPLLWSRFLKRYWTDRNDDTSAPMNQKEADRIIEWTTWLVPVYAEAVELACQTTHFNLKQTSFFSGIERSDLPDKKPLEVIKLLTHVLKDSGDSTLQDWYLRPIYKRLAEAEGVDEEDLKELRNIFLRMGVFKAE